MKELLLKIVDIVPIRLTIVLVLAGAIIFTPLFFLSLTGYTRTSETYCMSCHEYWPDAETFFAPSASHHASVKCVDCHIENSTSLISGLYYADDAFVSAKCLMCHSRVLTEGYDPEIIAEIRPVNKDGQLAKTPMYRFSMKDLHRSHIEENIQCVDCHRNIQHDRFQPRTNLPRIDYCIQCHPEDEYAFTAPKPELMFLKESK